MSVQGTRAQQGRTAAGDEHRLAALSRYAVLDTPREEEFDEIATMAARLCDAPVGLLSFIDDRREWVKAASGGTLPEVERSRSFGELLLTNEADSVVIADARSVSRFGDHPWVTRPQAARFYASVPLLSPAGFVLGTVAVIDTRPRQASGDLIAALRSAARIAMTALEHRREAELAGSLTCVVGFDGRFIRVSAAWERLLGYSTDELIGRRATDLMHPDDYERTVALRSKRLAGEGIGAFENRYLCKDGSVRWLLWDSQPVPEEQLYYAAAKDITQLKQHEIALQESEERYRLLAENGTDVVSRHALDTSFTYVSRASEALVGYTPDELKEVDVYDLVHPEDEPSVAAVHRALLQGTERVRLAFRVRRKDRGYLWVESLARTVRDDGGRLVGFQATTRDITEQKRALDALASAEERFRTAFDDAPTGMAIIGLDGRFQRVNRALCELLGYSRRELLRRSAADVTHPDSDNRREAGARALLAGSMRSLSVEEPMLRRDGESVWVAIDAGAMRDVEGNAVAFLTHFVDLSERRLAEADARAARSAAESANRAKSEFLSRTSHELRTPLNAILGFARLLEHEDLGEAHAQSVARIARGGRHMLDVLNDVIDISRIEIGELALELVPVSVADVVGETMALLAPLASMREMSLTVERDGADPCVRADRQRLQQVLLNLVSNAIKYGPAASEVRVELRAADGDAVRVSVVDQGPGLEPADVDRIFEAFERLETHATVEGTGLGLALSQNLVRAMGGEIRVDTRGPGSTFWFELPRAG